MSNACYPIIDLFAGPGGLGEEFVCLKRNSNPVFKSLAAIERDECAHKTLHLRHFFRALNDCKQSWFRKICKNINMKVNDAATSADNIALFPRERHSSKYIHSSFLTEWFIDKRMTYITGHEARAHMCTDLHRYFFSTAFAQPIGISPKLSDFPSELLPNHRNVDAGKEGKMYSDRFRVQLADRVATTVTSHISKDRHYFIHYDPLQYRSLTVREAARLQTFLDNYHFEGPRTQQYHQVGTAVPPYLAHQINEIIADVLDRMGDR